MARKRDLLCCPACQNRIPEKTADIHVCECGCETDIKDQLLCAAHAFSQGRCRFCGADLDAKDAPDDGKADKLRRRRELREAVKEKDSVRDVTTARRRRTRKECGKQPPVRQRHRVSH